MSARRARGAWLFGVLLLLSPLARGAGVLVLPAEPRTPGGEQLWVGQAVADLLPRDLEFLGVPAIANHERVRAHELLEIPNVAVARATSVRMAEALQAQRLVLASYAVEGASVSIALRLLDVERGTVSAPLNAKGALVDLRQLLHGLAWDVALAGPNPPRRRKEELGQRDGQVPFEAFRNYCQALRPGESARRLKLLKAALQQAPRFEEAQLELGRLYLAAREYAPAAEALGRVAADSPAARGARFLQGVALYELGRYADAVRLFALLAQQQPGAAVLANQAMAAARGGLLGSPRPSQLLRAACELEPGARELVFDLGWALLMEGDGEAAAFWLRGILRQDQRDVHARVLLTWALRRAGHAAEADQEWRALLALAPGYEAMATQDLGRRFERLQLGELLPQSEARSDAEVAASRTTRAERLLESGDAPLALSELTRAAVLDPYSARAHRLLARAHHKLGDQDKALAELRMSLWCREDAAVRVELAQLLVDLGRVQEGRHEAAAALKADPENAAARRLLEAR